MRYEKLFAHTDAVMRLHLSKKKKSIAHIFIFKTFPATHFYSFLIIINALLFTRVAINGTACLTALLLWRQVVERKKKNAL